MPEAGRKQIGHPVTFSIEPDLLYPFVRWEDVGRFCARSTHFILVTQDPKSRKRLAEEKLKTELPNTYKYLKSFERELKKRSGFRKFFDASDPFYSVYNVNQDGFAETKAVWKTMGHRIEAVVLTPTAPGPLPNKVPFHKNTLMFVPLDDLDEAHYLVAILNSSPVTFAAKSYSVSGGKGFGATNLLEHVAIPRFRPRNELHQRLAALSKQAHELAPILAENPSDLDARRKLAEVEEQIDRATTQLWGLTDAELGEIRNALKLLS